MRSLDREVRTLLDADPERVLRPNPGPVDLRELSERASEDLQASVPRHDIVVEGEAVVACVDSVLVERAVWNLVHN
ncbi:MAG: hypothetical protein J7M26_02120 [Armatimonadetes bacterium]|nr:hypothetical protein [Armatimonadota bacterium]